MANTAATFKQVEVTRACKGVVAAGLTVAKVVAGPDGSVTVYTVADQRDDGPNPFDERLK